jgi:hypothetical protein
VLALVLHEIALTHRCARRHALIEMLDALGKWSFIDIFVLVMMVVAFHFRLAVPVRARARIRCRLVVSLATTTKDHVNAASNAAGASINVYMHAVAGERLWRCVSDRESACDDDRHVHVHRGNDGLTSNDARADGTASTCRRRRAARARARRQCTRARIVSLTPRVRAFCRQVGRRHLHRAS